MSAAAKAAGLFPGGHVPPELVGFATAVAGADDRKLHDLLLKKGDAQRAFEHRRQDRVGRLARLLAGAASQIGVHHPALNRPRAHNRDLHHEVVKIAGAKARKHRHLGATFDLKDANAVGPAEGVIDDRILRGDLGESLIGSTQIPRLFNKIEPFS